jgi:dolichol kinase
MHDPAMRPANYTRSLTHVASGVVILLLIQLVLQTEQRILAASALFAAFAWTLEITRRLFPAWNAILMKILGRIAHGHEWNHVNSSTWYGTALFGLSLVASPMVSTLAVMVLGWGDPAAGLVGRRYGRTRFSSGRSLEGSLGFVVVGSLGAFAAMRIFYPGVAMVEAAILAVAAAVAGAVAELMTRRLDDNLVIPLAAAGGAGLVTLLFR